MAKPNKGPADNQAVEDRIFREVTPKIVSFLKWRYFYLPLMIFPLVGLLGYFGVSHLISSSVESKIDQEIERRFASTQQRVDSLYKETHTLLENEKKFLEFYNGQFNIFMRQYELILPLVVQSPEALQLSKPMNQELNLRYESLKKNEGIHMVFTSVGGENKFSAYLFKYDSIYLAIEIPSELVVKFNDQLNAIGYLKGVPLSAAHPEVAIRAEAFFKRVSPAIDDIERIATILFGMDRLYTMQYSVLRNR